jgi:hypothetical protein
MSPSIVLIPERGLELQRRLWIGLGFKVAPSELWLINHCPWLQQDDMVLKFVYYIKKKKALYTPMPFDGIGVYSAICC